MTSSSPPSPQEIDTGLVCLLIFTRYFGIAADAEQLRHAFGTSGKTFGDTEVLGATKRLGLKAVLGGLRTYLFSHTSNRINVGLGTQLFAHLLRLIAFNMLAGRMSGPVLRLAQLWQDFQQAGISVERLGDVLNAPAGRPGECAGAIGGLGLLSRGDHRGERYVERTIYTAWGVWKASRTRKESR